MNKTLIKFSIVTAGFLVLSLTYFFTIESVEKILRDSVTKSTQASNAAITRIFANELFPEIETTLNITSRSEGLSGPDLKTVDTKVRTFMLGTDILKTKIFNLDGTTLYSTEQAQIGETRKNNKAFQQAAKGGIGSQITHKGKFSAIDQVVFERDLVASYVPVRDKAGRVVGVVEIYTDRTKEVARIPSYLAQIKTVLMIALSLAALVFAIQFWLSLYQMGREEN